MVFFQTVLFAGYAYAHLTTKYLGPRQQAVVHLALLAGAIAMLPIAPDDSWSDIFSRILSERVEPELGLGKATLLTDYPAAEAALARRKSQWRR